MNTNFHKLSVFTLSILFSTPQIANAATFEGSSSAVFGTPTPESSVVFSGVGTNTFTTGEAVPNSTANIFVVDGLNFSTTADTQFSVADLTYTNGVTTIGTNIDTVPLDLNLAFTTPDGLSETFTFTFDLVVTPNTAGDPVLDADTLSILNVLSSTNFTVGSENFTLRLLGFSDDNGATIDNTFTLPEDATTTSQLFGVITNAPNPSFNPVPESKSKIALLVLGLGLIAGWKYKSKNFDQKIF